MKLSVKSITLFCVVATMVLNALPVMSVYSTGRESCTFIVRGFNLIEFSPWGAIPISAILVVLGIFLSCQSKASKHAEILLLLTINLVCYAESVRCARIWLEGIGSEQVTCHAGLILLPLVSSALMVLLMKFCVGYLR